MRLRKLEVGHRLPQKLQMLVMSLKGSPPHDMTRCLLYRPEFLGHPFLALQRAALRGPSDWSFGERELFAAFVAVLNKCPFCAETHGAFAAEEVSAEVTTSVFSDWKTAPVNEKVRAGLRFLEKLVRSPEDVRPGDIELLREAGVADRAIVDVLLVCAVMSMAVRIADALGFSVPPSERLRRDARRAAERMSRR